MSSGPIVVTPDARPQPLEVGEAMTVLTSGAQTGSYEVFLQVGGAGSGPPPHHHTWDEAFFVLNGEVRFGAGELEETAVGPGSLVHIPGGTTHWFRFGESGAEMLSITSPAGAAAFFAQVSQDQPDFDALVRIAASHGATILPPSG